MPRYINIAARLDAKLKEELQGDVSWDDIKDAPEKLSDFNNDVGFVTTDTTYSNATTSADGLMSSADKTKLNGIATGATSFSGDYDDLYNKPEGVAVADAVDETDVVAQLNSLLASLRAAKLIAE